MARLRSSIELVLEQIDLGKALYWLSVRIRVGGVNDMTCRGRCAIIRSCLVTKDELLGRGDRRMGDILSDLDPDTGRDTAITEGDSANSPLSWITGQKDEEDGVGERI
ncbi:unnamed protein product [Fusarium graminearum]|nr:unnamed protein product [Fusarium graminearum]CZS82776.1 unnamed protein product [Fusarium graminearum]